MKMSGNETGRAAAPRLTTLKELDILDTSPEERFERLTRLAKRLFNVPIALVSLVEDDRQWISSEPNTNSSSPDAAFCDHAIRDEQIMMVPDISVDQRFAGNPLLDSNSGIRFYAGCPLHVPNGSRIGTLCLIDREPRTLDEEDKLLLSDLARMAEQELAAVQLATLDELTRLSNRRGFLALAQHVMRLCDRLARPATLVFMDLDDFKPINDRYGHAEGDRALVAFAQLLRAAFRESDVIARIGGDEFVALATNSTAEGVAPVLERLGRSLDEFNQAQKRGYDLKFSHGLVEYSQQRHPDIHSLIEESDQRMYRAKRARKARPE